MMVETDVCYHMEHKGIASMNGELQILHGPRLTCEAFVSFPLFTYQDRVNNTCHPLKLAK
jgi:hypothetical protein